ncbi:DUF2252 domain-containing protein [Amycolatopsis alkalitolerans]|uniref:DUF2252 domain-containing protein n=1 Tax=Amycolatopsis alkalitolerans TaxID=2547244 RepID=A0A5C4M8T4_9PSEU|nr:DUF2252 domain-containing protein [Amycolatopsis alkalitolerans]
MREPTTGTAGRNGLTAAERAAVGKAARSVVPRSRHAEFARDPKAPPPLALLAGQDEHRVPELLPIRYERMALSPFSYFRGAALPMASDLVGTPRTGLTVQACGDAHLSNFGLFASPERRLVFDINDFDETLPGPWEWDVKRLAASLEIAGRDNGYPRKRRHEIVTAAVAEYRRAMREFSRWTVLRVWYAHADVETVESTYAGRFSAARRRKLSRTTEKARARDHLGALRKFTRIADGVPRIASDPPLIVRVEELGVRKERAVQLIDELQGVVAAYRETLEPDRRLLLDRYRMADFARKVVGVGSVGTRCWMLLLLGKDDQDPLFLQAKEAGPSVLEDYLGPSEFGNCGQRVVVGQRLMQAVSDIFLGWVRVTGLDGRTRDFYLRQLRDWKGSADIDTMEPAGMLVYGRLCGWTLARAHARTGDAIAIGSYLGSGTSFDAAIGEFARVYADQNERDHAALLDSVRAGGR